MFLRKGVRKIRSKLTEEHPCRSAISIKFLCNFTEIVLRLGCSPVNLCILSEHLGSWVFFLTEEHPCRSAILIKLLCNFTEIVLRLGCSPVNLMYTFRTSFHKNISGGMLL